MPAAVWLSLIVIALAPASPGQRMAAGQRNYDVSTEKTLSGSITEVREVPGPGRSAGVHLVIATDNGPVTVHVGPKSFLDQKHIAFAAGDRVEVTGSAVTIDSEPVVVAREIKRGEQTVTLRDKRGIPVWSRGGRG
jgi:hypothetical protein